MVDVSTMLFQCPWFVSLVYWTWYFPGFVVGDSGKALGMGSGILGILSFQRNRRFRKVILPDLSTLTRYWWLGRVSVTWPVVSHQRVLGRCTDTICTFWREHRVYAVRFYRSLRWAFRQDFGQRLFNLRAACRVWVEMVWSHLVGGGVAVEQGMARFSGWVCSCIRG